jgi:CDGSH-type Zn-finger protein
MAEPRIAQKGPYQIEVEAGKEYWWCSCGESKQQPFCDGSHATTPFKPMPHTPLEAKSVYFCGCKFSSHKPFCDGTHGKL